jgi:hypothetical protein
LNSLLIFISLAIFGSGSYLVWPSRYNVMTHLTVGATFIASFVPSIILSVQDDHPQPIVDLYVRIISIGCICYVIGLFAGFSIKPKVSKLSFNVMPKELYEKRILRITKNLLYFGVIGLALSYAIMGFVPIFASDPIAAKFFRGAYQAPYLRAAILYRTSFFILSSIITISFVIWYERRQKVFLYGTVAAVGLMFLSLSRGPAFTGLLLAVAIIMSFKSRFYFKLLLAGIIGLFLLSSLFYYVIGIKSFATEKENGNSTDFWSVIAASAPDESDQLQFLEMFQQKPVWTYGQTLYGGLIPGHYKWNPSVYTLNVVDPNVDTNDVASGGLRLPVAMWGYVSYEWTGVIIFCLLAGIIRGIILKYTKLWILTHNSLLIRAVIIFINIALFEQFAEFYDLSLYYMPAAILSLFFIYRFRTKKAVSQIWNYKAVK